MTLHWYRLKTPLLSIVALLLILLAILGTNLSLMLVKQLAPHLVPGLSIQRIDGNLWQGFHVHGLRYQSPILSPELTPEQTAEQAPVQTQQPNSQWDIQLTDLHSRVDWSCLQRGALCLTTLQINGLRVQQQPDNLATTSKVNTSAITLPALDGNNQQTQTKENNAHPASLQLQAPWPLKIEQLELQDINIDTAQVQLTLQQGATGITWQQDELQLSSTTLHQLQIQLPNSTKPTNSSWQLPDLAALQLPTWLRLQQLTLTEFTLLQAGQDTMVLDRLTVAMELSPSLWQFQLQDAVLKQPALQAQGQLSIIPDANTAELGFLGAEATIHTEFSVSTELLKPARRWQVGLKGSLGATAVSLAAYDDTTEPVATLTGQLNLTDATLPMTLALQASALSWQHNDQPQQLSQLRAAITGNLAQLAIQGQFHAALTELPLSQLSFQLQWQQASDVIAIEQLQVDTLGGRLALQGRYQLATAELSAQLALDNIQPGLFWPDYPGRLSGDMAMTATLAPDFTLELPRIQLQGLLRELPFTLHGELHYTQKAPHPQFTTTGLFLQHGANALKITGRLSDTWQAQLQLQVPNLSQTFALADGQLQGDIDLSGPAKQPTIQFALNGSALSYLDDYQLGNVEIAGKIKALGQEDSQISVRLQQGQAPGLQLQQLDWQWLGTLASHQSHLVIESHQLQAVVDVHGRWQQQRWLADWQEVRLKSDLGDWQLQQALQSQWAHREQTLSLSASCWHDQQASLCVDAIPQISLQRGDVKFHLQQFELAALNALLPDQQSLSGLIHGEISFGWRAGDPPVANIQLQGDAGVFRVQSYSMLEIPWQQLALNVRLDADALLSQLQLQFSPQSRSALAIKLTDLASTDRLVDANLQLTAFDLAFLKPLLSEYTQFDGMIAADIQAKGRLSNPALHGQLSLERLTLSGPQAPLELLASRFDIVLNGYQATVNGLWQTPQGPLVLDGSANWLVADQWFSQLRLQGQALELNLPDLQLTFSPDLQFTAGPTSGSLVGEIVVPKGHMSLNSLPENAVRVSEDEIILASRNAKPSMFSQFKLATDIRLILGEDVRLAAFGLDTRLAGQLRLRQEGTTPRVHGQVNLNQGTFRAFGQDLIIRQGKLNFNGPVTQPLLAIEAIRNPEKTDDDVIAGLRVNGVVENPVVEVFSIPSKPQANALSYLLLGRDMQSGGDRNMTAGLISLGIASSGGFVGQIGEAFGLKELSLDTAGSGDKAKVLVSGYLSPRLQVKYGVGIFDQFGEFTLRYRLMRKLYLEAVRGLNKSVDLLYKVEFD